MKTANFKRFEREAQLCSQLDHPNICTIYDFHEANGIYYIAMQWVDGKNVRQLVNGRPLEVKSTVVYMPDSVGYYDELTAREILRYSGKVMGLRGTVLARSRRWIATVVRVWFRGHRRRSSWRSRQSPAA